MSTPIALIAAVVFLAANAFFVAAEFALLAARRSKVEQLATAGDRRARHALAGMRELSLMLAGAQLGITICSLLLGAVAEPAVAHLIEAAIGSAFSLPDGATHAIGFTIALSVVVFLHMVVGEMAPKSWAISHPERSALTLAMPFRAFALLVRPVIAVLNFVANSIVRLTGVEPQGEVAAAHSPADLLLLLSESTGDIDGEDRRLLTRTLELSGLDAEAAMTARHDIVSVASDETIAVVAETARRTGRSRVLVHEGDLDHICGIIHVKDILALDTCARATTLAAELSRDVPVTPEGHLLEDLLVEMRTGRQHLSVVVDEHGIVTGIVTLEDVLEELIGDFEDESDRRSRRCRRAGPGRYVIAGGLRPDELADRAGIELPDGDWETVAGYITATLDRVPELSDTVTVGRATLTVTRVDGYAVTEISVNIAAAAAA